ncbi:hypothetical protein C2L89_06470 [Coxiella burnetii]|nr:hypothetical protein C2L89_06470 [Coxiella burnetii]
MPLDVERHLWVICRGGAQDDFTKVQIRFKKTKEN